ncbi:M48 family metallopeptidase [Hymenobacter cellulosilyticus]|uniref:M48 family metallopeptidase n=1 Tax=Hymenobacter cellulosilyticus TaxID=2932248 RepID=A0A8T9Q0G6_9BACT|nr:SprT family zinc-dependent metalloprotease [Hymenobacter cellulosilyticus]UOQ70914.1 M48 family metallopeptidase [Hymenobacter cellulosilyticus]
MPHLLIDDLRIEVVRKNIRSLRLTVYAPDGRVRVAAPLRTADTTIHAFVTTRRAWIRKHQEQFAAREQPVALEYVTGETHFYQGRTYQLRVHEAMGPAKVLLQEEGFLDLFAPANSQPKQREKVLHAWYRARLKEQLPALAARWEPVVGARANEWGIKLMRTRWGTCSIRARRIWLNLELIKQPVHCLEYVVVHELVHLHERLHNARFWGLMDQFMPDWREAKQALRSVHLKPCG